MKIKSRNDILTDIIQESKNNPKGWKAVFGKDNDRFSSDCYICHPDIGIYLIKEYQKNPFNTKGIGTKIARSLDEDIEEKITKKAGDFGIIQGNMKKILRNLNNGMHPQKIFEEGLKGNDLGITIPVKGKASASEDAFTYLHEVFSSKQKKLDKTMEKIVSDDGIYTSYG